MAQMLLQAVAFTIPAGDGKVTVVHKYGHSS